MINKNNISWFSPEMTGKEIQNIEKVLDSNFINDGPVTREFENAISEILKVKYCVAVTSCTAGLSLALFAFEIGNGDDVIVPNLTFIATANAVRMTGANVILADVDPNRLTLDIRSIKKVLTKKTKAIISVEVNGRASNYKELEAFCKKNNLNLITDSAEAFGSIYKNKPLGSYGDVSSLSFSPAKTITTGQGGLIATNNQKIYQRLLELKDQGRPVRGTGGDDDHPSLGFNFKFTDLQAAVGLAQLDKLEERLAKAKERDYWYLDLLDKYDEIVFPDMKEEGEIRQWTDILLKNRKKITDEMHNKSIGCRAFWKPLSIQPSFKTENHNLENSLKISAQGLWLPSNFSLTWEQAKLASDVIIKNIN